MDNTPSTAEQHADIRKAAKDRVAYLLWLADKLEQTADPLIRKDAAKAIRELLS
jgi:hypothetical protein